MEALIKRHLNRMQTVRLDFVRSMVDEIDWDDLPSGFSVFYISIAIACSKFAKRELLNPAARSIDVLSPKIPHFIGKNSIWTKKD